MVKDLYIYSIKEVGSSNGMMELLVNGVSDCIVHLTILYLTAKNESGSAIQWQPCKTFGKRTRSKWSKNDNMRFMKDDMMCIICQEKVDQKVS